MNTIRTISDVLRDKADETKKGITFVENRRDEDVPPCGGGGGPG